MTVNLGSMDIRTYLIIICSQFTKNISNMIEDVIFSLVEYGSMLIIYTCNYIGELLKAMSGRVGKFWVLIFAVTIFIAAMGSSSVVSHAQDLTDYNLLVAEPAQPAYEESEGDSEDEIMLGDYLEASLGYDVCFFIRNGVDADIPNEPVGHPASEYSEAIRINQATTNKEFIYCPEFVEGTDAFESDGYTAHNGLTDQLSIFPTAQEIKTVVASFDEKSQYVIWYVLKGASTNEPNSDVNIHVDGVIRTRQHYEEGTGQGEEPIPSPVPAEGPEPTSPQPDLSGITFNVYSEALDCTIIDGEEYIGGFVIEVTSQEGMVLDKHRFGITGQEIGKTLMLGEMSGAVCGLDMTIDDGLDINWGKGTDFVYMGQTFHVNVDAAYVKSIDDEFLVIPLLFNKEEVKAGDIRISDEVGNVFASVSTVPKVNSKQKITVTAGTSVQNDRGQTLTNTEAIVTDGSLMKGHRIEATFIGCLTGPGECTNEISDIHIYDRNGRDATAYYDVELKKGRLVLVADGSGSTADNSNTGSVITETLVRDDNKASVGSSQQSVGSDSASIGTSGYDKIRLSSGDNEAKSGKISATEGVSKADQQNAGSNRSAEGAVLGARRADTGENSMDPGVRLVLIVLCIMLISIINIKRNKTN